MLNFKKYILKIWKKQVVILDHNEKICRIVIPISNISKKDHSKTDILEMIQTFINRIINWFGLQITIIHKNDSDGQNHRFLDPDLPSPDWNHILFRSAVHSEDW